MRYILATSITLGCSSMCLYLMKYFLNRKRKSEEISERREVLEEKLWGSGKENLVDTCIRPCSLDFSEQLVQDLKDQLKHFINLDIFNDFPNKNKNCAYSLQGLLSYWLNNYNFDERNKLINKYRHYKTKIQGLDIHFIRVKPDNPESYPVLPLLLLHGWPSSIMEFYKTIPLLAIAQEQYKFAIEVIIPSLPGFGLSSAPKKSKKPLSCIHMSVILKNLMLRIGHSKFYVYGCDWTAYIVRIMSSLYPQNVLGMHLYLCAFLNKPENISSHFSLMKINERVKPWNKHLTENEYFHIHTSNVDTIGFGLNNSPGALAAYIMEKFLLYTNLSEEEILNVYTYDDLIDNLMIYWTSKCIATSKQIYAEQFIEEEITLFKLIDSIQVTVPCGFTQYFGKFMRLSNLLKKQFKSILRMSYSYGSGRFPALEQPEYFADDLWLHINNMKIYWHYKDGKRDIPRLSTQKKKYVF